MKQHLVAHIISPIIILSIAGCATVTTHGTNVVIGEQKNPTNPNDITFYSTPPTTYEEIAIIYAESADDAMSKQALASSTLARLKEEAANVGANAILLESVSDFYAGSSGIVSVPDANGHITITGSFAVHKSAGKKASGIAIFIPEVTNITTLNYSTSQITDTASQSALSTIDKNTTVSNYSESVTISSSQSELLTDGVNSDFRNESGNQIARSSSQTPAKNTENLSFLYNDEGSHITVNYINNQKSEIAFQAALDAEENMAVRNYSDSRIFTSSSQSELLTDKANSDFRNESGNQIGRSSSQAPAKDTENLGLWYYDEDSDTIVHEFNGSIS
jgi:hypothetical protein